MGSTHTWREYVGGVRDVAGDAEPSEGHAGGAVSEGTRFWLRHDLLRVMDVWGTAVPADQIRVVTVPPRGGDPAALLQRFSAAVELPQEAWADLEPSERNVSFGAAELEVLRRLNGQVADTLPRRQYRWVVEHGLRPQSSDGASRPLALPAEHLAWARERDEHLASELRRRDTAVFGDVDDLRSADAPASARALDDVTTDELLVASETLLASLAEAHGKLFGRYRQAFSKAEGRAPRRPTCWAARRAPPRSRSSGWHTRSPTRARCSGKARGGTPDGPWAATAADVGHSLVHRLVASPDRPVGVADTLRHLSRGRRARPDESHRGGRGAGTGRVRRPVVRPVRPDGASHARRARGPGVADRGRPAGLPRGAGSPRAVAVHARDAVARTPSASTS